MSRSSDYRVARIAVAIALSGAIVLMVVADVLEPGYSVDPVVVTILGMIVLTLLGLEARDLLWPGPPR